MQLNIFWNEIGFRRHCARRVPCGAIEMTLLGDWAKVGPIVWRFVRSERKLMKKLQQSYRRRNETNEVNDKVGGSKETHS